MNKGTLFYVVGASGVGKDSLIAFAKEKLSGEHVKFATRYITRPADAGGEEHVAVSQEQFQKLRSQSQFVLQWQSHGNWYGIHKEIDEWLSQGINVVVNGSRGYLLEALHKYPTLKTLLIMVNDQVLRERLTKRGRESGEEIERRIERNKKFQAFEAPGMIKLNNDQPLHLSGAQFISHITQK